MNIDLSQLTPENLTRMVIDLNAQRLAQIDPALPELMRACAIPVAFNAEIVSQLISVSVGQPDSASAGQPSASQLEAATALSHLLTLPFIIQRQDGDYTYHDNSRNLMLADWQNDRPRYMEYVSRLVAYYEAQGEKVYWRKEYETALTWFNRALELQPSAYVYNLSGRTQVLLGNYAAAVTDLTQAIQQQVADEETYFNLSVAHYYLNDYAAALNANSETIRLNPQDEQAFYNRAILHQNLGQAKAALADYNKAIRLSPQIADAYYNRGNLYLQQKQFDLAIADFNQAIQINPQYALAYYNRGRVHALQGQANAALQDLRQAFALDKAQGSTKCITLARTDSDLDSLGISGVAGGVWWGYSE